MSITDNFITGLPKKTLIHVGANQTPKLLVIHYSVTNTVAQAVAALNAARLSYHILIEKNGDAFQTRRFTESALHPGLSNWKAGSGVTLGASVARGSIGICLMNKGFAFDPGVPNGPGKLIYNPDDASMQRWEKYPAAQIASVRGIAKDIIATYPIAEVVGHHDIAIMGKFDPGPLFDLDELNAMLPNPPELGFRTTVQSPDGTLNLRRSPNSTSPILRTLGNGATVHIRSIAYGAKADCIHPTPGSKKRYLTRWASVDVDGSNRHAGFVHMGNLASTPLDPSLAAFL
ncbi:N-acetylmuramoyl-L-alanine amidase [Mesorhizobium sp. ASY16-5R]|uniref:N-acetylmuramoyl-L-alanine amidase n=1 Tax=Mesorhizobium sp. ASY16-5R TaxID=3445772 RepID=UPI003FA05AE8